MTNEQILKSVIKKARVNDISVGFQARSGAWLLGIDALEKNGAVKVKPKGNTATETMHGVFLQYTINRRMLAQLTLEIIFSLDFARAYFGEDRVCKICGAYFTPEGDTLCKCKNDYTKCFAWQYHLQQYVIKEEPLKYIERFL